MPGSLILNKTKHDIGKEKSGVIRTSDRCVFHTNCRGRPLIPGCSWGQEVT